MKNELIIFKDKTNTEFCLFYFRQRFLALTLCYIFIINEPGKTQRFYFDSLRTDNLLLIKS